ncbi:hypothetical protein [Dietzia sp. ANT_WB102]|uniref:hypothetical protein n=1 Tax=Dietzia sp. ANT_WB102 TaxID=2597345 RepID=UPI0011EFDE47|nr:hypothetical protein [Dietzia sp. ANT_WB102]KAA0918646.1 hypothetical protein FQ137_04770 [Dietzia sp. ANT_WB102]
MTTAPAPTRELTIAVLGARESAAPAVADALTAVAGPAADAGARIRVLVGATPEDRPDAVVLVVDAVCPVRPDDVEVARGVAARLPMAVALAGRAGQCTGETLSEIVDVTTRRLADAGVTAPVHVVDEGHPGAPAALLAALVSAVRGLPSPRPAPGAGVGAGRSVAPTGDASTPDTAVATVDWLLARRTEAITTRSQALRQDVQALRMEVVQDLHRSVRDLGGRVREELAAAPRARVDGLVHRLAADADDAVAGTIARADRRADALVARHLGAAAPVVPRIPPPTSGITPGRPPRNTGEEMLVMVMGAAGGTGVGRMLLSPLAEIPGVAAMVVPLALLCGLVLGRITVTVRRTQALRTHTVAAVADRLATLRAEAEQSLGSRILAAEATITDGFAHDPGPRVADLERRIRATRARQPAPTGSPTPGATPVAPRPSAPTAGSHP